MVGGVVGVEPFLVAFHRVGGLARDIAFLVVFVIPGAVVQRPVAGVDVDHHAVDFEPVAVGVVGDRGGAVVG